MISVTRLLAAVAAVALSSAAAVPGRARAAFPGRDGEIAFTFFSEVSSGSNGDSSDYGIAAARLGGRLRVLRSCSAASPGETGGSDMESGDCSIGYGKPAFSADGRSIAFSAYPRIAIMDANGRHFHLLSKQTTGDDVNPVFSPHGGRLLFEGRPNTAARSDLYVVDVSGANLRRLTYGGASEPAWSSTGRIAFVRDGQIYVRSGRGPVRRLTGHGTSPSWSPSGRSIAFIRNRDVYVMRGDGRGVRRLTRHHVAAESGVVFSPSGNRLAFGAIQSAQVEVIDLGGRRLGAIDTGGDGSGGIDLDWQPLR